MNPTAADTAANATAAAVDFEAAEANAALLNVRAVYRATRGGGRSADAPRARAAMAAVTAVVKMLPEDEAWALVAEVIGTVSSPSSPSPADVDDEDEDEDDAD